MLELESVDVDIPNRINDAQLKSQHNSKLVGAAAGDTQTSTTSYIDD